MGTQAPKVSIVTCTYNRPAMLRECIRSLRAQSEQSWEHLIFDAASNDPGVAQVLDEEIAVDPRVRGYCSDTNVDQPARYWNILLDRVRGKYVGFLDDDNTKHPDFLARLSAVLDLESDVDMVTCGMRVHHESGAASDYPINMSTANNIEDHNTIDSGCFLIRREALERVGYFPLDVSTNEDWAFAKKAVSCLRIRHLPDCLHNYRVHKASRMERCASLGDVADKQTIRGLAWSSPLGVRVESAPSDRLTMSQIDVIGGVARAVQMIPWVVPGDDVVLVTAPFQLEVSRVEQIARGARTIVSVHMEDPYALGTNVERVRAMAACCPNTWVATNDTGTAAVYRRVVGQRVIVCPSLSIDSSALPRSIEVPAMGSRQNDVVLVGYAYPSRVQFMRDLSKHFDVSKIALVGDGWEAAGFKATPTTAFMNVVSVYGTARSVICLHRRSGDCGVDPQAPLLVARGYVEGVLGARVFVDDSRPDYSFERGEVEWFGGPEDLAVKLTRFLSLSASEQVELAEPLRLHTLTDFTYRTRIARVINSARSQRFDAIIP